MTRRQSLTCARRREPVRLLAVDGARKPTRKEAISHRSSTEAGPAFQELATTRKPRLRYASGSAAPQVTVLRRIAPAPAFGNQIHGHKPAGLTDARAWTATTETRSDEGVRGRTVRERAGARMREVPEPDVGEHDVLVEVRAASVNPLDAKIRDGEFKLILPYRVPFVLGHDMAGQVVRVGSAVRSFAPGDAVYARPRKDRIGTFAELIAVHEDDLALKPSTLTMVEAAALPLVALTAWQALVERANLRPGQKVLVHAGSGGVGTIAIQLAKHLGAHVATTAGTANVKWVEDLGADVVVDYRRDDFETILRDYDVVLDSLGGETLEKSLRVLKPGGIAIGLGGRPTPLSRGRSTPIPSSASRQCCSALGRGCGPEDATSGTRSSSCGPAASSSARSPPSSTPAPSDLSWTGSSRSSRRRRPWPTSVADGPRARWWSPWADLPRPPAVPRIPRHADRRTSPHS